MRATSAGSLGWTGKAGSGGSEKLSSRNCCARLESCVTAEAQISYFMGLDCRRPLGGPKERFSLVQVSQTRLSGATAMEVVPSLQVMDSGTGISGDHRSPSYEV